MTIIQELKIYLGHTMFEMQYLKQSGAVSDRLYRHFCFLWLWSAQRWDDRHERFYKRMGSDAYWRRIDRVKALCARIQSVELPPANRIPFRVGTLNP